VVFIQRNLGQWHHFSTQGNRQFPSTWMRSALQHDFGGTRARGTPADRDDAKALRKVRLIHNLARTHMPLTFGEIAKVGGTMHDADPNRSSLEGVSDRLS
jgi:hypothetical protein